MNKKILFPIIIVIFSTIAIAAFALSSVTLNEPEENEIINEGWGYELNATTDDIADNATFYFSNTSNPYEYEIGTVDWQGTQFYYYWDLYGVKDMTYNVTVNASNDTTNVTDTSFNVTVAIPPYFDSYQPDSWENDTYSNGDISISILENDEIDNSTILLTIDGISFDISNTTDYYQEIWNGTEMVWSANQAWFYYKNNTWIEEQIVNATFYIEDVAGNSRYSAFNFTVDLTPPNVTLLDLNKDYATNNENVTNPDYRPPFNATYNITDNVSYIDMVGRSFVGPTSDRNNDQWYGSSPVNNSTSPIYSLIWNGEELGITNGSLVVKPITYYGYDFPSDLIHTYGLFDEDGAGSEEEQLSWAFFNKTTSRLINIICSYDCQIQNGTSTFRPVFSTFDGSVNSTTSLTIDSDGSEYNLELGEYKSQPGIYIDHLGAYDAAGNRETTGNYLTLLYSAPPGGFYINETTIIENELLTIDAKENASAILDAVYNTYGYTVVAVANYSNINDFGIPSLANSIKFIEVESLRWMQKNLTTASIKIYYNDNEISGLDENSLKINLYNGTNWQELATAVNKNENYASANITDFGFFGLTGSAPQQPQPPQQPSGGNTGSGPAPSKPEFIVNDTKSISINAGKTGTSTFVVKNTLGYTLVNFEIVLTGIPASWYKTNAPSRFDTDLTQTLTITFNIPSDAELKDYPITITARGTRAGTSESKEAINGMILTVLAAGTVSPIISPIGPTGAFSLGDYSWILGIIALIIILLLLFFFRRRKEGKGKKRRKR